MRKDAKKIKELVGFEQILFDLKPNRCDSDVYINQEFDLTNFVKYMEKKKKKNDDLTYFHGFVAALGKIIYNREKLNYFVANRHLYCHNEISISFVAKVSFDDKSEEMMICIPIEKNDDINTLSDKIYKKVHKTRNNNNKQGANKIVVKLGKLPNLIRIPIVEIFKWVDRKGLLPKSLIKDNVYYSSMLVSNLGSINCDAIYHNLTNFGTCSSLATIGKINEKIIIENNKEIKKYYCNFGINLDERIADGFYFVKSMHLLQYIFDNPQLLDKKMDEKIDYKI